MQSSCSVMNWCHHRKSVSVAAFLLALCVVPSPGWAHHGGHKLLMPSPRCGWIDGESVRDRRNLADFCADWMPAQLRISSASADRESLWIEAAPELESVLREQDRTMAALLRTWLEHWRKTTGYKTASVILVSQHIEFARIQTTMTGDVVMIR
jgi:hypothetical protein